MVEVSVCESDVLTENHSTPFIGTILVCSRLLHLIGERALFMGCHGKNRVKDSEKTLGSSVLLKGGESLETEQLRLKKLK